MPFVPSLAWRDSRRNRRRLFLYVAAMALGVAALVAIRSFGANLPIQKPGRFAEAQQGLIDSVARACPGATAREVSTSTMAFFPDTGGTRLVQVRALRRDFPFYGASTTVPDSAASVYQARG